MGGHSTYNLGAATEKALSCDPIKGIFDGKEARRKASSECLQVQEHSYQEDVSYTSSPRYISSLDSPVAAFDRQCLGEKLGGTPVCLEHGPKSSSSFCTGLRNVNIGGKGMFSPSLVSSFPISNCCLLRNPVPAEEVCRGDVFLIFFE